MPSVNSAATQAREWSLFDVARRPDSIALVCDGALLALETLNLQSPVRRSSKQEIHEAWCG